MSPGLLRYVLILAIALTALGGESAWADRFPRSGPRDGGLPASVRRVQRETGGEVLKAQPIERDGREIYRVKVLTPQGRIRVVEDEPQYQAPPSAPPRQLPPAYPRQPPAYRGNCRRTTRRLRAVTVTNEGRSRPATHPIIL